MPVSNKATDPQQSDETSEGSYSGLAPLISDEGRAFLKGKIAAEEYLESGRRHAAYQVEIEVERREKNERGSYVNVLRFAVLFLGLLSLGYIALGFTSLSSNNSGVGIAALATSAGFGAAGVTAFEVLRKRAKSS